MNVSGLSARATKTGVRMELRVTPRASRNGIGGVRDGRLIVRVTAPPVDDAANDAVVVVLAQYLSVPKRTIHIVAGATGRQKSVELDGIAVPDLLARLDRVPD